MIILVKFVSMPILNLWNYLVVLCGVWLKVCLICFPLYTSAKVDERALSVLEKTSAYYQALENFCVVAYLTIKYPEEEKDPTFKMTLTARAQQYRLCYDQKETICDGETIWVYDKELKELIISEYAKTDFVVNFAELYNLYQQGYEGVYMGEQVVQKKSKNIIQDRIKLIPLSEDSSVKYIILEIDRSTSQIHGWEIVQNEETRYICKVKSFFVNIQLAEDYFIFDVNAHGALEIIDLREKEEADLEFYNEVS
jgi:outer membrane lipoprotein-sorting protein